MVKNYLKVIFRNFKQNKIYSLTNILGLALGYSTIILISIYLHFETSYENFHSKADRIYRPTYQYSSNNGFKTHFARIPESYINELPNEFPEIDKLIRFQNQERKYVRTDKGKFRPEHVYVTDKEVFEVFDLPLVSGNPKNALAEPYSVVITASLALQYFGNIDVLGEDIFVVGDWNADEVRYKITGVLMDIPGNTHLPIDMLISFKNSSERSGWAYTYVLLNEGANIEDVNDKMPEFIHKYSDQDSSGKINFEFQKLTNIHLHSDLAREIIPNGNIFYVKIFFFIGLFILLIALTNFITLSNAMFIGRYKEVGLRKILGAGKSEMAIYLITESITYNIIALMFGAFFAFVIFPFFSSLTSTEFMLSIYWFSLLMILIACSCGLLSSIYPILRLNMINPVAIIKNTGAFGIIKKGPRLTVTRILLTIQFCLSIILIGSAFIAMNQFQYLNDTNLGIAKEQILAIPGVPDKVKDNYEIFKNRIKTLPGVIGVSGCMEVPSREIRDAGPVHVKGLNIDSDAAPVMDIQIIDHDYLNLLGIKLIAGNNIPMSLTFEPIPEFTENYTYQDYIFSKRRAYIINETAMKQLGWQSPEEALGKEIDFSIGDLKLAFGPIVGVIKDYHQESLKNTIDPTIMVFEPIWLRTFLVKLKTEDVQETISKIKTSWDEMFPNYPIEYHFLDDLYEDLYKNDRVQLQLLYLVTGLAIVIAFIGLFGLITYSLKTRLKEIAIRKVIGSDTPTLISMISKEYLLMMIVAGMIGIPTSYYFVNNWLQSFAYKVGISFFWYLLSFVVITCMALIIISVQTIKVASINPVDTLRNE